MAKETEYVVTIREVHHQKIRVKAADEKTAIKKIQKGEGDYLDNSLEYCHTIDPEGCKGCGTGPWEVEED